MMSPLRSRFASMLAVPILMWVTFAAIVCAEPEVPDLPPPPPLPDDLARSGPPQLPPDLPDARELMDQLRQLDELLSMDPERLTKLRETIELIERMSAGERETMRIRLSEVTRMTPELREEIRLLSRYYPEAERGLISQFWLSLTEEQRASNRKKMNALAVPDRVEWFRAQVTRFREIRDRAFEEMRSEIETETP